MTLKKIVKKTKDNIVSLDYDVLLTFSIEEWKEWIIGRLAGKDPHGLPVGGTHARTEPCDFISQVGWAINKGYVFERAEAVIESVIMERSLNNDIVEMAHSLTRGHKGYSRIEEKIINWIFELKKDDGGAVEYIDHYIERGLSALVHMQEFADPQYRDIYEEFFGYESRDELQFSIARQCCLGMQCSNDYGKLDKHWLKVLVDKYDDERRLYQVYNSVGYLFNQKSQFMIKNYRDIVRNKKRSRFYNIKIGSREVNGHIIEVDPKGDKYIFKDVIDNRLITATSTCDNDISFSLILPRETLQAGHSTDILGPGCPPGYVRTGEDVLEVYFNSVNFMGIKATTTEGKPAYLRRMNEEDVREKMEEARYYNLMQMYVM